MNLPNIFQAFFLSALHWPQRKPLEALKDNAQSCSNLQNLTITRFRPIQDQILQATVLQALNVKTMNIC